MKLRYLHLVFSTIVAGIIIAVAPKGFAAQLTLLPAQDVFLFAGVSGKIPLTFQHQDSEPVTGELTYRIFQASAATLAPISDESPVPHRSFPPAGLLTVQIPFTPPDVRAITSFVLKVSSNDGEIGSISITVVPPRVFARLDDLNLKQIFLFEPEPSLGPLLKESRVQITGEPSSDASLHIVHLPGPAAESDWKDRATTPSPPTLFIVGRGVTGAEKLLPVKTITRNGGRVIVVQDWFIPDLKQNPLSQLRLLRAIQSLAKPEAELDPGKEKN